jgi:hypothetical protein
MKFTLYAAKKSTIFNPGLARGHIRDSGLLIADALATGYMYGMDGATDRRIPHTADAIRYAYIDNRQLPVHPRVVERAIMLDNIPYQIGRFAQADDYRNVLKCYTDQVLVHELAVHDQSREYEVLDADAQSDYLSEHGADIADAMVRNAGVPSVVYSLYAAYRSDQGSRPPSLSEIEEKLGLDGTKDGSRIPQLFLVANALCRLADDLGDMREDTGNIPGGNMFSLNLFNQADDALLKPFCELARIPSKERRDIIEPVKAYRTDPSPQLAEAIRWFLVGSAHRELANTPEGFDRNHEVFMQFLRRVLTIGIGKNFNIRGDQDLAAHPNNH